MVDSHSIRHNSRKPAGFLCTLVLAAPLCVSVAVAQNKTPPPPPPAQGSQRVHPNLSGFDLSTAGQGGTQVNGGSRGTESPLLYAPRSGKAYDVRPEFHWTTTDPGQKVVFTLSTLDGTVIYAGETTDDHLKYPSDAAPLTPGASYTWTIAPQNEMQGGPAPSAVLLIVGGAEREKIQSEIKSAPNPSFAAMVLVNHRVWYDAIERYSALLAQKPDDQMARTTRAELYEQLPATKDLAEADWRMVH